MIRALILLAAVLVAASAPAATLGFDNAWHLLDRGWGADSASALKGRFAALDIVRA